MNIVKLFRQLLLYTEIETGDKPLKVFRRPSWSIVMIIIMIFDQVSSTRMMISLHDNIMTVVDVFRIWEFRRDDINDQNS